MQEKISFWQLLKLTFRDWMDDQASQLAAALAYYTAVSIAPLLVLIVVLVGLFLGAQATRSMRSGGSSNSSCHSRFSPVMRARRREANS